MKSLVYQIPALLMAALFPQLVRGEERASRCLEEQHMQLELRIADEDWDGPAEETVRGVLQSTADELLPYFPAESTPLQLEVHPKGGPIVLYDCTPDGWTVVRLNTGKFFWAQYAFQFSHELCHVLCRHDRDPTGNDWFEESLCETASLFVLRRMGETWETEPPYDHWADFAPNLTQYAQDRANEASLSEGQTAAQWYAEHAEELHGSATRRELNRVIASILLPLFEESPDQWAAVAYINIESPKSPQPFAEYLAAWRRHCPEANRPFVDRIADEFGISLP